MATALAYNFLEAQAPGKYVETINDVLDCGGVIVQHPEFFLTFVVRDRVARVVFACGNMRRLLAFAHTNAELFGYDYVEWARQLCGSKHQDYKRYSMKRLRK